VRAGKKKSLKKKRKNITAKETAVSLVSPTTVLKLVSFLLTTLDTLLDVSSPLAAKAHLPNNSALSLYSPHIVHVTGTWRNVGIATSNTSDKKTRHLQKPTTTRTRTQKQPKTATWASLETKITSTKKKKASRRRPASHPPTRITHIPHI
jgi:hypothetical protein